MHRRTYLCLLDGGPSVTVLVVLRLEGQSYGGRYTLRFGVNDTSWNNMVGQEIFHHICGQGDGLPVHRVGDRDGLMYVYFVSHRCHHPLQAGLLNVRVVKHIA